MKLLILIVSITLFVGCETVESSRLLVKCDDMCKDAGGGTTGVYWVANTNRCACNFEIK